jgi:hypothetical protein
MGAAARREPATRADRSFDLDVMMLASGFPERFARDLSL